MNESTLVLLIRLLSTYKPSIYSNTVSSDTILAQTPVLKGLKTHPLQILVWVILLLLYIQYVAIHVWCEPQCASCPPCCFHALSLVVSRYALRPRHATCVQCFCTDRGYRSDFVAPDAKEATELRRGRRVRGGWASSRRSVSLSADVCW